MTQEELKPYYDDILNMYKQGITLRKIGKKYDSGHSTIKGLLIKNGDFIENREILSITIPENEHQNIVNLYNNGDEVIEIAEKYGIIINEKIKHAGMVELADTQDLGSCAARCAGSTPVTRTTLRRHF